MEIDEIRAIRTNQSMRLRPSPYLRDSFSDEFGAEVKVVVRNYQAQGIMNLLQVPRMILSDDTGLGKTLQTLCTVGYVWMMEPEYVPIVVTRKSSLYQWDDEIRKFMKNMSAVVVDGEPYERDAAYRDFFGGRTDEKRLLVMTYDTYLKDFSESVVRDRSKKAPKAARDKLAAARKASKEKKEAYEPLKTLFKERFDGRNDVVKTYLVERMKPSDADAELPATPSDWSADDEALVLRITDARRDYAESKLAVDAAKDLVEPPVVAAGVGSHISSFMKSHPGAKLMLIMDEAHVAKNYQSKLHEALSATAEKAERVVLMTATPVQNRLMEFFSLFRIAVPRLFPKVTHFQNSFCIMKMQKIGNGRQVPIVVGHSKDQIERFVQAIEPFYLSRRKYEVAKELPELITREVVCVLSQEQQDLYEMAELEAEEAQAEADPDKPDTSAMRCMTLIQQASDAPQLVADEDGKPFEGESSKMEALVEALQGAPDMKVLVFSRFKKMIDLVDARLKKEKIRYTRVTGDEGAKERIDNVKSYQDPKSGVNVMLITTAGTESLNLQATEHIILLDSPWSWGVYAQLIGRGIRLGSRNLTVLVTHLIARIAGGRETIDDHVVKILRSKRKLADAVAGESIKGGLEFSEEDMVREVLGMVRGAKKTGKTDEVRDAVRVRVQSARAAKRRAKKAAAAETVLSAIEPARPAKRETDLGVYVSMDDI